MLLPIFTKSCKSLLLMGGSLQPRGKLADAGYDLPKLHSKF